MSSDPFPISLAADAPRRSLLRIVDSFGAAGSMLCALHCAALPLLLAALPALGLTIAGSTSFERFFVVFASSLALISLWQGYRRHRIYRAWLFVLPGLSAVWLGVAYPPIHHSLVAHAVAMTFGGTMIAIAHLINLKLGAVVDKP